MGNVNSNQGTRDRDRDSKRDRHKSYDLPPSSYTRDELQLQKKSRLKLAQSEDVPNFIEKTRFNVTRQPSTTVAIDTGTVSGEKAVDSTSGTDPDTAQIANLTLNETFVRPRSNTVSGDQCSPSKQLPTVFRWEGGGKQVSIGGDFSQWKTVPMARSHGDFVAIIDLPEGEHAYKFYVDGEWKHDPETTMVENKSGTKSNVVNVKKSDFEVFQALDKDIEDGQDIEMINFKKEYSQDIPSSKPWEKCTGPPGLPPHLSQIILNKDTALSCDPTLLPEPNHVMLNHLFALSIKEGVMVLSASHRYRKKCVTTLLYKQI